jgi:glycosyltransferase involved in cell wall biosynthesis
MNIAYVSTDFGVPIFGYKGASRHVREVVSAWGRAGHAVWVLSPALHEPRAGEGESNFGEPLPGPDDALRATVADIPGLENARFVALPPAARHLQIMDDLLEVDAAVGRRTSIRQELRSLLYNATAFERAHEFLRARGIDFVYERYAAFSWAGILTARALGVPHVLEVNAPLTFEHEKRRGLELKTLALDSERRIFLDTDHVVVVSSELRDVVTRAGVPPERVSVLSNAVDPERFSPARAAGGEAVRARYGLDDTRVIGFVGTLKPWHGVDTLIEAFRGLHATEPRTRLLLVGDGPERQALERRVDADGLGHAVTFAGNVRPEDVPDCIAAMDVTVAPYVPSDSFYYSPLKIFEYMAMAKPVVAGEIGQVRDLVAADETGILYEPGNVPALTRALARLVGDPPLCEAIGGRARAFVVQQHSWAQNGKRLVALACALIHARKTAAAGRPA